MQEVSVKPKQKQINNSWPVCELPENNNSPPFSLTAFSTFIYKRSLLIEAMRDSETLLGWTSKGVTKHQIELAVETYNLHCRL